MPNTLIALPGVSGSLFPRRFLASHFGSRTARGPRGAVADRHWRRWWAHASRTCGPATSVREIFDQVASPATGMLGFRAGDMHFGRQQARGVLITATGCRLALIVRPWSSRPPGGWRDACAWASEIGAGWCLVVAPPSISIVDTRGHGLRRSADFWLPTVMDSDAVGVMTSLAAASNFEGAAEPPIAAMVDAGMRFQDRVREDLRHGVVRALSELTADATCPFDEALAVVFRILFLFFAESRRLVPADHPVFGPSYTVGALCREAAHDARGVWDGLAAITRLLRRGCRSGDLTVAPFNGQLFARTAAPGLERSLGRRERRGGGALRDRRLGLALVALGTRGSRHGREEISYADLGVEQLGAVYEHVLDLAPAQPSRPVARPHRSVQAHSRARKETGTFYTPQVLAELLVRRTLGPLVDGATADAILALRVVDPAMGSGACLVAACRFLADAYERALVEEGRLGDADVDDDARADFRRLVAERCLAGVDLNPTAVQLARLSVWLTSLAKGRPLGFLDHRLRVGNSLVGATPGDLQRTPGARRTGETQLLPLFEAAGLDAAIFELAGPLHELATRRDNTVEDVRAREALWRAVSGESSPLEPWRLASALWCAHWFWPADGAVPRPSPAEWRAARDAILRGDRTVNRERLRAWTEIAADAARVHRFFHWPLEFPDVFLGTEAGGRAGGFDAVIGNPPWEVLRADGEEPTGRGTARRSLANFLRGSGAYPGAARGHINLYLPFLERALAIGKPGARIGLVLPWGFASDDGAETLRRRLIGSGALDTIIGLENSQGLFPVHRGVRFALVVAGSGTGGDVRARFGVRRGSEVVAIPARDHEAPDAVPLRLDRETLGAVGGRSLRLPDVRQAADLTFLTRLGRTWPRLSSPACLGATFGRDLNASDDRGSLGAVGLSVLEGKHIAPFLCRPDPAGMRIRPSEAARLIPDRRFERERLAYRDVSGVTNRQTLIAAVLPAGIVTTHTLYCLRSPLASVVQHYLCGVFNSFVLNAVVRILMGSHLTTGLVEDLPVPPWVASWLQRRIAALARRLAEGDGPGARPLRVELESAVARLYDVSATELERILRSFPLADSRLRSEVLAHRRAARGANRGPLAL